MQTSSKDLAPNKESELFDQLATLLADLRHPAEVRAFLREFLSETERSVFAKRLAILWELSQGKSYQQIKDQLQVSSATISSVAEFKDSPNLKTSLKKISLDKKLSQMIGGGSLDR